jgi:hypothetical protein
MSGRQLVDASERSDRVRDIAEVEILQEGLRVDLGQLRGRRLEWT